MLPNAQYMDVVAGIASFTVTITRVEAVATAKVGCTLTRVSGLKI